MPVSKQEQELISHIVDLMQSIGPVSAKSMFGGHGIFLDSIMFGLVADGELYLKTDEESEAEFTDKGLEPFVFSKQGRGIKMSYHQAPEEVMEDSDEMNTWANKGYAAAVRAAAKKLEKPKKKKH